MSKNNAGVFWCDCPEVELRAGWEKHLRRPWAKASEDERQQFLSEIAP